MVITRRLKDGKKRIVGKSNLYLLCYMLGLLYFGRLEQEKGVDGIIDMVRHFGKEGKIPFELFVFGSGSLEEEILELTQLYPEVHFFGWKPLEEIIRYVENCQYCLMPSTFLETF